MLRMLVALPLGALFASACTPTYRPEPRSGRISVTSHGYVKKGETHKFGMFRGSLIELVEGVPQAERAARTSRSDAIWAFAIALPASICTGVSLGLLLGVVEQEEETTPFLITTPICLGAFVIAGSLAASSDRYHLDAINIYNDAVDRP
jgi:hypothetical protein